MFEFSIHALEFAEEILGCRPRIVVEPRSMPELDREQIVGMPVSRCEEPLSRLGPVGQPRRKLIVDGDQLPAGTQRLQRRHEPFKLTDAGNRQAGIVDVGSLGSETGRVQDRERDLQAHFTDLHALLKAV